MGKKPSDMVCGHKVDKAMKTGLQSSQIPQLRHHPQADIDVDLCAACAGIDCFWQRRRDSGMLKLLQGHQSHSVVGYSFPLRVRALVGTVTMRALGG